MRFVLALNRIDQLIMKNVIIYASIRWSATAGAPSSSPRFPVVRGCRAATLVLGRHPSAAIRRRRTRVTKTRLDALHART